jgi:hypothetical protein
MLIGRLCIKTETGIHTKKYGRNSRSFIDDC